ncbi:MAG: Valine--tRNA ligase [Firmicutes bacterium]|nr:Valine--tRNA ligase [Bacillota bacterium]
MRELRWYRGMSPPFTGRGFLYYMRRVKSMTSEIAKNYDPSLVEKKWHARWQEEGYFTPSSTPQGDPFTIVIPPPNVTDRLHIGHALNNTLQDIIIRQKRMQGYDALWVPGTDHAGIATQNVVERKLLAAGQTRHDLGREKFVEAVWQWKEEYGRAITEQLRMLGASCDWSRERFTMDEGCSRAVRETFVRLYERGLIYRGSYIVNWCPRCHTAISDDEVEHAETHGKLYHVRYQLADGSGFVTVATTRPETILGDTAVAVHPEDARYSHLVGQMLLLPVLGRQIPIVADTYVDREFGTGAVKVTPYHDPNDFAIGERHNLAKINVLNLDGTMNENSGPFQGLDRYECRRQLLIELERLGQLVKTAEHDMSVGQCYRCSTVIEPIVSRQWFVRMAPLAEPAIAAVKEGQVKFVPERFAKTYLHWVENVKDWCISRQIWWGHQLPVWHCACGEMVVAREVPLACPQCAGTELVQETDVLDTWFSSALWPFETLGWPEENAPDLARFFPTNVLVTAYEIIYFWVARMVFMSLELTGQVPFSHVLIHGIVRDQEGRKMSKSLGNGIDPLPIIEQFGADTLRFTLVNGNAPGGDMRFHQERLESTRNFCNKIWNAARFVQMNIPEGVAIPAELPPREATTLADKYILSRLAHTAMEVTRYMERFEFGEASRLVYEFLWTEYCDWYIEMAKTELAALGERKTSTLQVLTYVLSRTLELMHPFMPFITEEIWQSLPHQGPSITVALWPSQAGFGDEAAEQSMLVIMEAVRSLRNLRAEMGVAPSQRTEIYIVPRDLDFAEVYTRGAQYLRALASGKGVQIVTSVPLTKEEAVSVVVTGAEIYLPLRELVNIEAEIKRLEDERTLLMSEVLRSAGKISNEGFLAKAPPALIEQERVKLAGYEAKLAQVEKRLGELK